MEMVDVFPMTEEKANTEHVNQPQHNHNTTTTQPQQD